jgi:hypothetical protein
MDDGRVFSAAELHAYIDQWDILLSRAETCRTTCVDMVAHLFPETDELLNTEDKTPLLVRLALFIRGRQEQSAADTLG